MPTPDPDALSRCWECEEPIDAPVPVTLRTALRDVATLALCPRCYRTCYFPLAAPAGTAPDRLDGTVLIESEAVGASGR